MENYDNSMLWKIGNHIGRTLKLDTTTFLGTRGNYARVRVQVGI